MAKTWCVGGRHKSNPNNFIEFEKVNPRTKKLVKILKVVVVFAVVINHKFLPSKLLKEKILSKEAIAKIINFRLCQIQHGLI